MAKSVSVILEKESVMKSIKTVHSWIVIALLVTVVSACAPKETILSGADREAVLAYSEAKTDNLMAGLNAGDYAAFSKDFDSDMLSAIPESEFLTLKEDRDAKLGNYISRSVTSVSLTGEFYVAVYLAVFEKDSEVTMRVVFRVAEPHNVSGLWFNK
jgi:hypothetical protein